MDALNFSGKQILLTGIGGIGEEVVATLSSMGASLILVDIDEDKLNSICNSIQNIKCTYTCNLGNVETIEPLVNNIVKENGAFDGFVFCTGIGGTRPFKNANYQSMLQVMNINFFSFIEILRCLTKKGNYNGKLNAVALSSVGSILGNPGQTAYCASKAAMNGAVRAIAKEMAPKNVRVNTIAPGTVETPMFRDAEASFGTGSAAFTSRLERQYLGLCEPSDIANAVVFLLSDMSRMITGSCLGVDGGKLTS